MVILESSCKYWIWTWLVFLVIRSGRGSQRGIEFNCWQRLQENTPVSHRIFDVKMRQTMHQFNWRQISRPGAGFLHLQFLIIKYLRQGLCIIFHWPRSPLIWHLSIFIKTSTTNHTFMDTIWLFGSLVHALPGNDKLTRQYWQSVNRKYAHRL